MEQNYNKDIKLLELTGRLFAQKHSEITAKTEILRLKERIGVLEATLKQLAEAIHTTEEEIKAET